MNDHIVICGYGSTGASAADDLMSRGIAADSIVVVDRSEDAMERATRSGLVGVRGDATHRSVLHQARLEDARAVIVAPNRDDTAVLITLTAREMNPNAHIVAGGREQDNLHLLRQGGADEVIDATAAVGRMLGLGTYAPAAARVLDDILGAGTGLELVEVAPDISGPAATQPAGTSLVAVIRGGRRMPPSQLAPEALQADDRLVVLRESNGSP